MLVKIFDILYKIVYFFTSNFHYYLNYKKIDEYYITKIQEIILIKDGNFFIMDQNNINALNNVLLIFSKIKYHNIIQKINKYYKLNDIDDENSIFIKFEVKGKIFYHCKKIKNIYDKSFESYSILKLKGLNNNFVSSVFYGDEDFTELFQKYSGPLNNFYIDTEAPQIINEIFDLEKNIFIFELKKEVKEEINISDLLLNDYKYFGPFNEIIQLENNIADEKINFSNNFDSKLVENNFTNFKFTIDKNYFGNLLKELFNTFNKKKH